MPTTFFTSTDNLVCVTVLGAWPEGVVPNADSEGGAVRDDGGLVLKLLGFQRNSGIGPARIGGFMTPGAYQGYYKPGDAARVQEWLRQQGAVAN